MKSTVTYPEGHVLLRSLSKALPVIDRGEGIYLFDASGKRYVDASSGALVVSVGHGNAAVAEAMHAQLKRVGYINGTHFTSEATEALAEKLAARAEAELPGAKLSRAAFLCSGSEAVEAASKFARQLWVERGQPQRTKIIARSPGYHGNTLYALALSARPAYRKVYGPMLATVPMVSAPYGYRSPVGDYARDGAAHYAAELEALIEKEGPSTIAAFIAEPVVGSSAGASVPPPGYFARMREVCAKHGILVIADEVMCGVGRTGNFFASRTVEAQPDLLVMGKGLGGGCAPLSAVLVQQVHVDEFKRGSGYFQHAQTYLQAPFITAAGLAVMREFERLDLVRHVATVGARFQQKLRARMERVALVGSVQGVGLLAGVELVSDRATKAPFPRSRAVIERLCAYLFERGLIVWPNVGHANGTDGDLFMLGPPLVITDAQVDELVDALGTALEGFTP